jgi:transcriptional regulator with XRE-family HTH domain
MPEMDPVEERIARRLKARREELALTLDALAERAQVSRAMISRIERRESSPTAAVLGRLCAGLGITLSNLMAGIEGTTSALLKARDQPAWRDPASGFQRRALTPAATGSPVEIVHGTLPPGARIEYPALSPPTYDQHLVGLTGTLTFASGTTPYRVSAGDCLHCALDLPHSFANEGSRPCSYLVVIARR